MVSKYSRFDVIEPRASLDATEDLFLQQPSDYLPGIFGIVVVATILAGTVFSVVRYLL